MQGIGTTGRGTRIVVTFGLRRRPVVHRPTGRSLLELAGAGALGGAVVFIAAAVAQWMVGDRHDSGPADDLRPRTASAPPALSVVHTAPGVHPAEMT
jgi:hypothetical protein